MNIRINPKYECLRSFVESLPEQFETTGTVIYEGRNILRRYTTDGQNVVVKRFRRPDPINRFVYGNLRLSKARRSFDYASDLLKKGINTPEPVACVEDFCFGLNYSYYVSLESPLKRNMREFWFVPQIGDRGEILDAFGAFTALMHESQILHRDYSAGNILFDIVNGKVCFDVVDINRIRFGIVDELEGYKNFAPLWLTDDAYTAIARAYACTRGFDEAVAVEKVLYYKSKFMQSRK